MSRLSAAIVLLLMSSTATCADGVRATDRGTFDRDGIRAWSNALARVVRKLVALPDASEERPSAPRAWLDRADVAASSVPAHAALMAIRPPLPALIDLPPPALIMHAGE